MRNSYFHSRPPGEGKVTSRSSARRGRYSTPLYVEWVLWFMLMHLSFLFVAEYRTQGGISHLSTNSRNPGTNCKKDPPDLARPGGIW